MERFEIAVVGGGLAGQIAALAMAKTGRRVAFIAPPARADRRTTALMDQSIAFLDGLGLRDHLQPFAAPLSTMQILDGTERLLRAPPVQFRASEVDLPAFGYNFANADLAPLAEARLAECDNATVYRQPAAAVAIARDEVILTLEDGQVLACDCVIGADGRNSPVRHAAGIEVSRWSYPQTALVLNFSHSLPHRNVSTEFHTPDGPFTQVPLPGNRSSLVWVMKPAVAEAHAALPASALSLKVEARMQSLLGKVTVEDGYQAWPLSGMVARQFGKGRAVLIGEAAHVFPPIGAQGLNLSLRDIQTIRDLVAGDGVLPADLGDRFDRRRKVDIHSRTMSVDLLNRSLLSGFLPVQMPRAAGLHLLSAVAPLRQLVMREGVEPGRGLKSIPSLFRRSKAG